MQPNPNNYWIYTMSSNDNDQLGQFWTSAADFMKDAEAPYLEERHLETCRVLPSRFNILDRIPKGGVYVEVGTQTGSFAKEILRRLAPKKLHIIDIDYTPFDAAFFAPLEQSGQVQLHQGDSSTILASFPDTTFDMIYVDGDHSYAGVVKDLQQSLRKIKPGGYIVCNDYTAYSPIERCKYGIYKAVNEFCLEHSFRIEMLGLHPWGYHDVALRKM